MDWVALQTFEAVCESLSFSAAARRLHVTHAAVSGRVSRLERQLGVVLLDRSRHHVAVTPAGELLRERYGLLLENWEKTLADLGEFRAARRDAPAGSRSGSPPALRLGFFELYPYRLKPYTDQLPGTAGCELIAQAQMHTGLGELRDGKLSALLAYFLDADAAPAAPAGVEAAVVLCERLHVLLPRAHRLAAQPSVSLLDLAAEPWIVLGEPTLAQAEADLLRRQGFSPRIRHATSDRETLRFLVASGQGVSTASPLFATDPGTVLRPMEQSIDSLFVLYTPSGLPSQIRSVLLDAVRYWYVDGLRERKSPWLDHIRREEAHPTLRAAVLAAAVR